MTTFFIYSYEQIFNFYQIGGPDATVGMERPSVGPGRISHYAIGSECNPEF